MPRLTFQTLNVLAYMAATDRTYGYDLLHNTEVQAGTLYPILNRLEAEGWAESQWEQNDPSQMSRPRRKYFRLTELGRRNAAQAVSDLHKRLSGTAVRGAGGPVTLIVLAVLHLKGHAHGGEIARAAGLNYGSVSSVLRQLEVRKLTESEEREPGEATGGLPRRYYKLTPLGKATAAAALSSAREQLSEPAKSLVG